MRFPASADVVRAHRWWKNGDHPHDEITTIPLFHEGEEVPYSTIRSEGKVVRYFRHPDYDGEGVHSTCGEVWGDHGWIDQGPLGIIVCPGDWVVTRSDGTYAVWHSNPEAGDTSAVDVEACRDCDYVGPPVHEPTHRVDHYEIGG